MCEKCSKEENERAIRAYVSAVNAELARIAARQGGLIDVLQLAIDSADMRLWSVGRRRLQGGVSVQ